MSLLLVASSHVSFPLHGSNATLRRPCLATKKASPHPAAVTSASSGPHRSWRAKAGTRDDHRRRHDRHHGSRRTDSLGTSPRAPRRAIGRHSCTAPEPGQEKYMSTTMPTMVIVRTWLAPVCELWGAARIQAIGDFDADAAHDLVGFPSGSKSKSSRRRARRPAPSDR